VGSKAGGRDVGVVEAGAGMMFSPDVIALNPGLQLSGKKTKAKYGNVPTEADGHTFSSKKEAGDYLQLRILQEAGQIANLQLQPRFLLQEAYRDGAGQHHRKIEYVADFMWDDLHTGKTHVLDSKGVRTPLFRLKEKLFRRQYPQYIFEVG
jgi:hypothetical protein